MKFDNLYFGTRSEAEMVLEELQDIANDYGSVSLKDYCDIIGIYVYPDGAEDYGWTYRDLYGAKVEFDVKNGKPIFYISLGQPNLINTENNKEENTMGPMNTKDVLYATYKTNEDPEAIEYEKKCKELRNEAEKKILDIRKELAVALQKLDQERKDAERLEIERKRAKVWKQKYDTLVEAGFSEDESWTLMMESFKAD